MEITRYEGYVAKLMGDGVLAYFGWPRAHEDDAERAVRAGMAAAAATASMTTPTGEALAARIGVATGVVVVGDLVGEGSAQEEAVVGETPNLAARLQALAEPNTVVIAAGTHRLVVGLFDMIDLGHQQLKGFTTPVSAWRITGEADTEGRLGAEIGLIAVLHRAGARTCTIIPTSIASCQAAASPLMESAGSPAGPVSFCRCVFCRACFVGFSWTNCRQPMARAG